MATVYPEQWPQFFTATIIDWKPLLQADEIKNIIVKSLQYMVQQKRINLFGFVIMHNHLHLIWQSLPVGAYLAGMPTHIPLTHTSNAGQDAAAAKHVVGTPKPSPLLHTNNGGHKPVRINSGNTLASIQHSFLKHTAQEMKLYLQRHNPTYLEQFKVNAKDRRYQFWKRNALSIELYDVKVFHQKLTYIHYNPVKAGLCHLPEHYYYSSASFYLTDKDAFKMLTRG